ncbi:stage III sporulation protein AA [Cytobacillus gottheilii]|uniref:stage III sporulation protein AA n=1 Tax=Cytobacillus gottheilii TaxID=859144 RepID=UPI0009BB6956|nr:stage III sporulation protein AA [Cytobacillus gottheilii]
MENILAYLPNNISDHCKHIPPDHLSQLEEIRVRIHRPLELTWKGETSFLPYIATHDDAVQLLNKISHHSIYTLEEELKRGFITIEGGHRIGLAGKVILEGGKVKAIRDISSFNIRIAKEQLGIADKLIPFIYDREWKHSMIIGPPQTGKTTLLRDIARIISSGDPSGRFHAQKVGIVDERSEIAGSVNGIPEMTFGHRLDVLDGCPKAEGMMMMIRSMSPDVLIVDEIGSHEDKEAIMEAVNAGIKLIMTTHGTSFEEIKQRPTLAPILEAGIFERFIELDRKHGPGGIKSIKDGQGLLVTSEKLAMSKW